MLIDFSVSGYKSFKNTATISMEKSKIQQHPEHIIDDKVLSGAAVYGANASGKTNLLQAIHAVAAMVQTPLNRAIDLIPFLTQNAFNFDADAEPKFDITFIRNGIKFFYSLTIYHNAIKTEKLLFEKNSKKELLFERNNLDITYGKTLSSSWYSKDKTARPNTPWLSSLEAFYGVVSNKIPGYEYFDAAISFFFDIEYINEKSLTIGGNFYKAFQQDEFKRFLVKLLKHADLGITDVDFVKIPYLTQPIGSPIYNLADGQVMAHVTDNMVLVFSNEKGVISCKKLVTIHSGCKTPFDLVYESAGTLKLIHLSLSLFMQKKREKLLLLDEWDSLLHPFITKALLIMLLNTGSKGQIITAMHNTYLLSHDIWRVDEIWFTTKNNNGESRVYPLTDINPRFDKNLEKDYINGKYGAIPFPGGERQWQEIFPE